MRGSRGWWIAAVAAAVLVAALGALLVALHTIDWSRYQEPLAERVRAATGRDLSIEGTLRVQLLPRPGVAVSGVHLANASWGSRPEMLRVQRVSAHLALLPLLTGRVVVAELLVEGADLLLERGPQGRANWSLGGGPAEPPAGGDAGKAPGSGPGAIPQLERVRVRDAAVRYRAAEGGAPRTLELAELRLDWPAAEEALRADLRASLDAEPVRVRLRLDGLAAALRGEGPLGVDASLEAAGAGVSARGEVVRPLEAAGVALTLEAEGPRLGPLAALVGAGLPDVGPWSLTGRVSDPEPSAWRVEALRVEVGSSRLEGRVTARTAGARPELRGRLHARRLAASDFGAAAGGGAGSAPSPSAGPADAATGEGAEAEPVFSREPLPLDALRAADLDLDLRVDQLVSGEATVEDLRAEVSLRGGRLAVESLAAQLAGGSLEGRLALDASGDPPPAVLDLRLGAVEVGALLEMLGSPDGLRGGALDADLRLASRGRSPRALAAGLGGQIDLSVGPGTLLHRWARLLFADLGEILARRDGGGERSNLNCLLAELGVDRGVARVEALALDTPALGVVGAGAVDLGAERLALRFEPVVKQADAQLAVPAVFLGGTLAAPRAGVDGRAVLGKALGIAGRLLEGRSVVGGADLRTASGVEGCRQVLAAARERGGAEEREQLRERARYEVQKLREELDERVGPGAGDLLKDLLGR